MRSGARRATRGTSVLSVCARSVLSIALASALTACSSLSFERYTATSGTFSSTGWSVTILSVDFPKGALLIARENASDANLANMVVESVTVVPYLGPFDWIFEFFCIRFARVSGTWGFTGQEYQSPDAKLNSKLTVGLLRFAARI